jgi:hypothetical protein
MSRMIITSAIAAASLAALARPMAASASLASHDVLGLAGIAA